MTMSSCGNSPQPAVLLEMPNAVQAWFAHNNWQPFPYQLSTWQAYLDGESGLVNAPTGMGKTLAVCMGPIISLLREDPSLARTPAGAAELPARRQLRSNALPLQVLWITPLRALATDTVSALSAPVDAMGIPWSVELRTGDTSSGLRQRQLKRFPTALVTTPESLSLLLTYPEMRESMKTLKYVVVDEWHELQGTKRGVQTELGLARLRQWYPGLRTWGLSATISNPETALSTLLGPEAPPGRVIFGQTSKITDIVTLAPKTMDRFPWSGHIGRLGVPPVVDSLERARTTLVFTNTRNQAENWYQWLTLYEPEYEEQIALHHGSIDRAERHRVEAQLAAGELRAVVCTSSLDLGVDFPAVDQVVQIGSPKGIARLLQRAGRSGHQPGGRSRILCVPTNAFELIEFAAARTAARNNQIEPRDSLVRSLDVLVQHLVTIAVGGGFLPDELLAEVKTTHAFAGLTEREWQWALDFVTGGGSALRAYPEYHKVAVRNGVFLVDNPQIARFHRLSIGTITSDSMVSVQYVKGAKLGQIEEAFIARLKPGDCFTFAGRILEFVRLREMKAQVRRSNGAQGVVPKWLGGRLPLSSQLSSAVRSKLGEARDGVYEDPEMIAVRPVLDVQEHWSKLPGDNELLVERTKTREGHHLFLYPFAGRLVHDGLAALFAYRLTRSRPFAVTASATDYGIELLASDPIPIPSWNELFSTDNLLDDLITCLNAAELAKRQFRDIARIAGLIFQGYPGAQKQTRQVQASSGLLYDVFAENDPENLLLDLARREVLQGQLEITRLYTTMTEMQSLSIVEVATPRLTPLAFPIWAERVQASISTEKYSDRIKKMVVQLEKAAKW